MNDYILDLDQRLIIIRTSSLDDVRILNSNYTKLIRETPESEKQDQFVILLSTAKSRILELERTQ